MSELWYKNITFEDAVELARENLTGMVETFIAAGYYLKVMQGEYEQHGYKTIWECAEAELGLKKSEASRAMSMNSKYSVDGNTPYIQEKYKQYSKSQLQEMLKMADDQIEQVDPDMTIREIREIKKPAAEQTEESFKILEDFMQSYVSEEYIHLRQTYNMHAAFSTHTFPNWGGSAIVSEFDMSLFVDDDLCCLVDRGTGELLEKYDTEQVVRILTDIFLRKKDENPKMKPDLKGLMYHSYCAVCGAPLNDPDEDNTNENCSRCGQAVDWKWWEEFMAELDGRPVATSQEQVNTEFAEELEEEITVENEEDPDQEELNIEFGFDELPEEWTPAIDADYRKVQELSAYGLSRTEYPEGSLIATKGCGHRYDCYSCAQECSIRQEERWCVEAACGNPFGCETMKSLDEIRAERGAMCQFVNMELAYKTSGSGEPVPCCKECHEINECDCACEAAKKEALLHNGEMTKPDERQQAYLNYFAKDFIAIHRDWFMEDPGSRVSDVMTSKQEIKEHFGDSCWVFNVPDGAAHINLCNDYVQIWDKHSECMGSFDWFYLSAAVQQMWDYMTCDPEDMNGDESAAETQQELPVLKNNDQRKQWLNDYEKWGLWYRDDNIDVNYYKFDFPDGSRLVVVEYPQRPVYWKGGLEDEHYYHLLEKNKQGYNRTYDEKYRQQADSESYLVEFLKNLQKKGSAK